MAELRESGYLRAALLHEQIRLFLEENVRATLKRHRKTALRTLTDLRAQLVSVGTSDEAEAFRRESTSSLLHRWSWLSSLPPDEYASAERTQSLFEALPLMKEYGAAPKQETEPANDLARILAALDVLIAAFADKEKPVHRRQEQLKDAMILACDTWTAVKGVGHVGGHDLAELAADLELDPTAGHNLKSAAHTWQERARRVRKSRAQHTRSRARQLCSTQK